MALQPGEGGRGKSAPDTSHQGISASLPGKERQGKKGKMEKKGRKIAKILCVKSMGFGDCYKYVPFFSKLSHKSAQ